MDTTDGDNGTTAIAGCPPPQLPQPLCEDTDTAMPAVVSGSDVASIEVDIEPLPLSTQSPPPQMQSLPPLPHETQPHPLSQQLPLSQDDMVDTNERPNDDIVEDGDDDAAMPAAGASDDPVAIAAAATALKTDAPASLTALTNSAPASGPPSPLAAPEATVTTEPLQAMPYPLLVAAAAEAAGTANPTDNGLPPPPPLRSGADAANPTDLSPFVVGLVIEEFPLELKSGLVEIARHCVHQNIVVAGATNGCGNGDNAAAAAASENTAAASSQNCHDPAANVMGPATFTHQIHVRFIEQTPTDADNGNEPHGGFHIQSSHTSLYQLEYGRRHETMVLYKRRIDAFRALGHILGAISAVPESGSLELLTDWKAIAQFDTIGAMIDCSRSAVLRPDSVQHMLRNLALMGLNTFELYTEDTYAVQGEPFFGFMRGVYNQEELRSIDDYADYFGIEMFPCIQTLGHLGQILQWPAYAHLKDTSEVLLANQEETYDFIRKLVRTASAPLRSRRIHIGMDEANGIGEGRYCQLFGKKDSINVYLDHLRRVTEICQEEGLRPLIWSDMLFTLASQNSPYAYYDDTPLPTDLPRSLPDGVQLVYWDYYHTGPDTYLRKIQQHRDLGYEPWVASAVWAWNRLFAALPFTFDTAKACLSACRNSGVRNVVATLWGDDGNECDLLSAMPGLAYFGEQAYTRTEDVDWATLKRNFAGICGGRLEDWIYASKLDSVPSAGRRRDRFPPNPSKWILWQDPVTSFLSQQYREHDLEHHFSEIAKYLFSASSDTMLQVYPLNHRLRFPALLAHVLSMKCNLREHCVRAYRIEDPKAAATELENVVKTRLRPLIAALVELHRYHRDRVWLDTFKPFGLEILEMRYGAIRVRLESMEERISAYCAHKLGGLTTSVLRDKDDGRESLLVTAPRAASTRHGAPVCTEFSLPEFEVDVASPPFPGFGMDLVFDFARAYTPSRALGTG